MKSLRFFLFGVFLFGTGSAAWGQVVATVGDKTITLKEFNERYDQIKRQTLNPPPKSLFLEDLIRFEMGVQEAEKRKMREDKTVQDRINQELYKALIETELATKIDGIKVTEAEMKSHYGKSPEVRTSHILIEVKPDATKEQRETARKRADEILGEVNKSKRSFEELVNMYTDDLATKKTGGDIGLQTRLTLTPAYYDAAVGMKVGQVKGLVESQFGFHIIKMVSKNSYEQANKQQVRAAVFDEKRNKLFNEYFEGLKKKYSIKVNSSLVK